MTHDVPRSAPTYPEYEQLRADAEAAARADGNCVDPAKLHAERQLRRSRDWRVSVLGHDRAPNLAELHMLLLADKQDLNPPLPKWLADLRSEQAARREAEQAAYARLLATLDAEWAALSAKLPVSVGLSYNYSGPNHLETWCQGAVHIRVMDQLIAGRLRRNAGDALCSVPSNRGHQLFCHVDAPEDRRPTCKACIRIACRLAGLEAPTLLAHRGGFRG